MVARHKKTVLLIVTLFCSFGLLSPTHAFQNEPDGFRGLTWGTSINTVAAEIEKSEGAAGQFSIVTLRNEKLTMGGAELSSIQYVFRNGWLFSVLVSAQNKENFESLKKNLFRKYGPVNPPDEKNEVYLWKGNITSIKLTYRAPSEEVILEIGSTKSVKDFAKDVEEGEFRK